MDRRTFLKVLAALGASVNLPTNLAMATPAEIDTAWTATTKCWGLFEVNDYGTLSYANFEAPRRRRDAYDLPPASEITARDIGGLQPLLSHVENLHEDTVDERFRQGIAAAYEADEDWTQWFERLDAVGRKVVIDSIDAWLDEEPDWDSDCESEYLYRTGDAQGAAYNFFLAEDQDVLDALSIVVVEGDCPGSSYFAAELRMDPDAANEIAKKEGFGLRFVPEGAA